MTRGNDFMTFSATARGLLALLLVTLAFSLFGCGGNTGPTPRPYTPPNYTLLQPTEDPAKNSAIGGTLFSMLNAVIDYPYNATVTLTGTTDKGDPYTDTTTSSVRGGYRFEDVPPGVYTVSASATSTRIDNLELTAAVAGVRARGNIPALMVNLLLGKADNRITFTGLITRAKTGAPAPGATVTVEVKGFTTDFLQGGGETTTSVLITTTTGADGRYTQDVPAGGKGYYVAAHADFSMVTNSDKMLEIPAGVKTVDLALNDAEAPVFAQLLLDMVSTTLPSPTKAASQQALVTRLAVARALHAPADRIARLDKLVATRSTEITRAISGVVENDVYWAVTDNDVGVRGYYVYRATQEAGPYTCVGSANDPYLLNFYDNDPALQSLDRAYYTVTCYAANGKTSPPADARLAEPLQQIAPAGPADGATVAQAAAQVSWDAVPNAKSYLVTIFYNAAPSFNMAPYRTPVVYVKGETSESFASLPPGDYWWSVSAYNTEDPNYATAATYSAYRKITIQ